MITASIKVRLKLIEVEPDGAPCYGCGDLCYLHQSDLGMRAIVKDKAAEYQKMGFAFCSSCAPIVKSNIL